MLPRTFAIVSLGLCAFALAVAARPPAPTDDEDYNSPDEESGETDKVYGGGYAPLGLFPFMVAIHRLLEPRDFAVCSGSVIARRWVLTAGHCVHGQPSKFLLAFGVVDKDGFRYDIVKGPGVSMISSRVFVHPGFGQGSHDIGLVHTPREIPFGVTIKPIRLAGPAYERETFEDTLGHVFGWGQEGRDKPPASRLSFGYTTVIGNEDCRLSWNVTDGQVCTAATEAQDVCKGDSGGPLVVREEDDELLQIGIVSYGDAGCPSSRPSVFTRVSSYHAWIRQITGIEFY